MAKICIIGAKSQTGRNVLSTLQNRPARYKKIMAVVEDKTEYDMLEIEGTQYKTENLATLSFEDYDIAVFCLNDELTKKYVPIATAKNCIVIDNSSVYRTDPDVPLIIPEVNGDKINQYRSKNIITNPHCCTIQMLMALKPLHDVAIIKRVVVSTYQSTSGPGYRYIEELYENTKSDLGIASKPSENPFPRDIAFNVIPQVDAFMEDGRTIQEWKMQHDTNKIIGTNFPVSATCVRVPVPYSHAEAVNVEFESEITPEDAFKHMQKIPGLTPLKGHDAYITSKEAAHKDDVYVSRIRKDHGVDYGLSMWIVTDNLRKGTALNAVQIIELLVQNNPNGF